MADTAVLNAEPVRPEVRKEKGLPSKTFEDAVQQEEPVNKATDAKSEDAPKNQNGTNGTNETGVGLKENNIGKDQPISSDGITNGETKHPTKESFQKEELGGKSKATTPETNGSQGKDFAGAVSN